MAKILVIDDDKMILDVIQELFQNTGYEVEVSLDGRIGLELQRQNPADVIITDIFMPGMEGTEMIMELLEEFPKAKIIAISGYGNVAGIDFLQLAENLGALKTFQKPFKQEELLAAVEELLA